MNPTPCDDTKDLVECDGCRYPVNPDTMHGYPPSAPRVMLCELCHHTPTGLYADRGMVCAPESRQVMMTVCYVGNAILAKLAAIEDKVTIKPFITSGPPTGNFTFEPGRVIEMDATSDAIHRANIIRLPPRIFEILGIDPKDLKLEDEHPLEFGSAVGKATETL